MIIFVLGVILLSRICGSKRYSELCVGFPESSRRTTTGTPPAILICGTQESKAGSKTVMGYWQHILRQNQVAKIENKTSKKEESYIGV